MGKSADLLRKRLNSALAQHGAVSEFCRETGFSRGAVDNWLSGSATPNLENIDVIAEALETTVVALLAPGEPADPVFNMLTRNPELARLRMALLWIINQADEIKLAFIVDFASRYILGVPWDGRDLKKLTGVK